MYKGNYEITTRKSQLKHRKYKWFIKVEDKDSGRKTITYTNGSRTAAIEEVIRNMEEWKN
jgi:hypothetical protein